MGALSLVLCQLVIQYFCMEGTYKAAPVSKRRMCCLELICLVFYKRLVILELDEECYLTYVRTFAITYLFFLYYHIYILIVLELR